MSKDRPSAWLVVALLAVGAGCEGPVDVEHLPPASRTIAELGRRLGRSRDPVELTKVAARAERVLPLLTRAERRALGRNALRFRVDRPAVVEVVAPPRSAPFWLLDQGFVDSGLRPRNVDGESAVYRKSYPAGMIGLGVNALDRTARTHYAVFVRAEAGGPIRVEPVEKPATSVVPAGPGVSPFDDAERPFEALPPSMASSVMIRTSTADRADGALVAGRVWKTRQPSGPVPDQVVVSFGEDPMRSLSITWRTDLSVAGSSLRIAREAAGKPGTPDTTTVRLIPGDAHPVESDGLLNDPVILRHRVLASGLEPDTRYAYSVGDGSPSGWGPWHSARTAPESPRDFGFLYLGDAQCGLERWGDLLRKAHEHRPDAGFLLIAGDLVDRGNERSNWDHFFLRAAGVFEQVPLMPAVGNHEYLDKGPEIYRGTFDLPRNGPTGIDPGLVYCFEYADAFVAVLDSTLGVHDPRLAQVQAEWLDDRLSRTRAAWKFVTFHHPVYASHPSRENPGLAAAWGPVFDRHHVDLVLQGHDHAYLRTRPMRGGRPVATPGEGTVYVVSVSGEKFYDQDPRDYTAKGYTNLATYQTIDVGSGGRRLTYRSFDREGREVDALAIDKGPTPARLAGSTPR